MLSGILLVLGLRTRCRMPISILYYTILYYTIPSYTIPCCTILRVHHIKQNTILYCLTIYYRTRYHNTLYSKIEQDTILYVLPCGVLGPYSPPRCQPGPLDATSPGPPRCTKPSPFQNPRKLCSAKHIFYCTPIYVNIRSNTIVQCNIT